MLLSLQQIIYSCVCFCCRLLVCEECIEGGAVAVLSESIIGYHVTILIYFLLY